MPSSNIAAIEQGPLFNLLNIALVAFKGSFVTPKEHISQLSLPTPMFSAMSVEEKLRQLKDDRLEPPHRYVYVDPKAKSSLQSRDEHLFSLNDDVRKFLSSKREVMLLLGDSGAGKSTFSRHLEQELWGEYQEGGPIPLFVSLPSLDNPRRNMIVEQLGMYDFTEDQILQLRSREFILICDGYDESQKEVNLYSTNMLNQKGKWRARMIVSCRSQHVKPGYQDWFQPQKDRYQHATSTAGLEPLQEAVLAPFSRKQIRGYVDQYVTKTDDRLDAGIVLDWTADDYMHNLAGIRDLLDLVRNPFILFLALRALPSLVASKKNLGEIRVSRVELYDKFTKTLLECELKRLQLSNLSNTDREAFGILEDDFVPTVLDYLKALSAAIFEHQDGSPVISYVERHDKGKWQERFLGLDPKTRLLRISSPLVPVGKHKYRFLHRSLLEYFYSRTFSDPKYTETDMDDTEPLTFAKVQQSVADHPLRQQSISDRPFVIQFLSERALVDTFFKQKLLAMIENRKMDAESSQAAAQAVEILTMAGIRFNGFSLSGVYVQRRS